MKLDETPMYSSLGVLNLKIMHEPLTIVTMLDKVTKYFIYNKAWPESISMGTEQMKVYMLLVPQDFGKLNFRGIPIKVELPKDE